MAKDQNLRMPVLEAVERLNAYGLEVVSGIILGLDTDDEGTADRIIEFIERSNIPMLTTRIQIATRNQAQRVSRTFWALARSASSTTTSVGDMAP